MALTHPYRVINYKLVTRITHFNKLFLRWLFIEVKQATLITFVTGYNFSATRVGLLADVKALLRYR